jgi:broad specificity phosphatase PhoE
VERLILARHGETDFNVRRLLNGDPAVEVLLTEQGEEEARRLGEALAHEPIDLCVTSGFGRTEATADLALDGRTVLRLVVADLGDPRYGNFEGGSLDEYRDWAAAASSHETPGPGESRHEVVARYLRGLRLLLARPERTILAVLHSLPIAYVLAARDGQTPPRRARMVENARPYAFTGAELARAVELLQGWVDSPDW